MPVALMALMISSIQTCVSCVTRWPSSIRYLNLARWTLQVRLGQQHNGCERIALLYAGPLAYNQSYLGSYDIPISYDHQSIPEFPDL